VSVSVVIPAWCWDDETVELLDGAITNIRKTSNAEVVVVYAGTEEGAWVARRADQRVVINPPQGWAAASNMGLLRAKGDFLAVSSVDVRLPEGWAPDLADAARTDGIASPLDFKGKTQRTWDRTERGSFWGAFFLFHRTLLEKVGYLDGYRMRRMADMDWAIRARKWASEQSAWT